MLRRAIKCRFREGNHEIEDGDGLLVGRLLSLDIPATLVWLLWIETGFVDENPKI